LAAVEPASQATIAIVQRASHANAPRVKDRNFMAEFTPSKSSPNFLLAEIRGIF
jgi:hypothetical protein